MPDPKRQKVVDAVDARFKTVNKASGYQTDLGADVSWWVMNAIDPEALPKVCLKDIDGTSWAGAGEHLHALVITCEIYLQPNRLTAARQMRAAIADITTCIGKDVTWGGLAEDTGLPDERGIHIEEREECFVAIGLSFVIQFLTNPWNAYE